MPFSVPASIGTELDGLNTLFEQTFQAGDMTQLVETVYHKDTKVLPQSQTTSSHC